MDRKGSRLVALVVALGLAMALPSNRVRAEEAIRRSSKADITHRKGDQTMSKGLQAVVEGNNRFAVDLYARLQGKGSENLFFSPYSIRTALAMTYAGAAGDTARQMSQVLHLDLPEPDLNVAMAESRNAIQGETQKSYQLQVANRLWGQKGSQFLPQFLDVTRQYYGAELASVDFAQQTEQARHEINDWVAHETADKIRDLLQPGVLDPSTRLVLTNAIYFKGNWQDKFSAQATRDAPFHSTPDKEVTVPMMRRTGRYGYQDTEDLQALEMPYTDDALSMVVLLPKRVDGLANLEKKLTFENLERWTGRLERRQVQVFFPRMKTTSEFMLGDVLQSLGMPLAFDPQKADFSRISTSEKLWISAVVHKAYADVNEEGTEAAAATGLVMRAMAAPIRTEPPIFRADHPFVYLIRDNRTGTILFLGRVVSPKP